MITTSAKRIKAGGFWCDDADAQTQQLIKQLGVTENDEIDIADALKYLGLSTALLALGSPHPRYAIQSALTIRAYAGKLADTIQEVTAHSTSLDRLCYGTQSRMSLCRERVEYWSKYKRAATLMPTIYAAGAMLILLGNGPLHIKVIHAGKELFSGLSRELPPPHEEFAEFLRIQLGGK